MSFRCIDPLVAAGAGEEEEEEEEGEDGAVEVTREEGEEEEVVQHVLDERIAAVSWIKPERQMRVGQMERIDL